MLLGIKTPDLYGLSVTVEHDVPAAACLVLVHASLLLVQLERDRARVGTAPPVLPLAAEIILVEFNWVEMSPDGGDLRVVGRQQVVPWYALVSWATRALHTLPHQLVDL